MYPENAGFRLPRKTYGCEATMVKVDSAAAHPMSCEMLSRLRLPVPQLQQRAVQARFGARRESI